MVELENAGVDVRILEMFAKLQILEEQQEAVQEWDHAVYFPRGQRQIEAAINGGG